MSDDNRFAGIGDAVDEDEDKAGVSESESTDDTEDETAEQEPDDPTAFSFGEAVQRSFYARESVFVIGDQSYGQ